MESIGTKRFRTSRVTPIFRFGSKDVSFSLHFFSSSGPSDLDIIDTCPVRLTCMSSIAYSVHGRRCRHGNLVRLGRRGHFQPRWSPTRQRPGHSGRPSRMCAGGQGQDPHRHRRGYPKGDRHLQGDCPRGGFLFCWEDTHLGPGCEYIPSAISQPSDGHPLTPLGSPTMPMLILRDQFKNSTTVQRVWN